MVKASSMVLVAALLIAGAPVPGGAPLAAIAAETAKPDASAKPEATKPPRRLSNSPDNIKKRECDGKWKVYKKEAKPTGWKPYFTFMANCM
jgi:hypothetical protein